jgi:hypothetical protein
MTIPLRDCRELGGLKFLFGPSMYTVSFDRS